MAAFVGFSRLFGVAANNCLRRVKPSLISNKITPACRLWETATAGYRVGSRPVWMPETTSVPEYQEEVKDTRAEDEKLTYDVIEKVNEQICAKNTGRLFAVVHVSGKQFKVTENDIIIIEGYWPPTAGDQLILEKVLLVGGSDFTLVGRPVLNRELVTVDATVIEKSLSHTKTHFRKKRRKQYQRINFIRMQHTMLRINSINISGKVNEKKEFEGLDRIY